MRGPTLYRRVALALVALLVMTALAACGGGGGDKATNTSAAGPTTAAGSPTARGTAVASPSVTGAGSPSVSTGSPTKSGPDVPATATAAPTKTSSVDHRNDEFAYGWNVAVRGDKDGGPHNDKVISAVQDTGFGWVRFQVEWRQIERQPDQWDPLPLDTLVNQFNSQGIKILIVVAKAPDWAVDPTGKQFLTDFARFQHLMKFLSERYQGKVQGWEIWNEENLAAEMGGQVRPKDYIDLLKAGSAGVREGDPSAKVVFGGLTPNGVNDPKIAIDDVQYLRLIYTLGGDDIKNAYDIMGAHVSSTHNTPDEMFPDNPGDQQGWNDHPSFFFRRAEQLRQVMLDNGEDAKPMWITEFGWTTANQAPGYEYGADNTEQDVADYLTRSFEIMRTEWDFVSGAFVWNLNWSTLAPADDEKSPWSAVNADWSPRPAYDAMKAMAKQ
jgi:polysaccharide biosynthesis protein PslG